MCGARPISSTTRTIIVFQPAVMRTGSTESALQIALIVVAVLLFVLILMIIGTFVYWRKRLVQICVHVHV